MIIFASLFILSILGFFLHLWLSKEKYSPFRLVELFLLYQLVFSVGLVSLLAFYGLHFMTEFVANYTGWPFCPFEYFLGNVNLAFFVAGIMSIWFRGHFWTAVVVILSVWLIGDGIIHLIDLIKNNNDAPGNSGLIMYTDLFYPPFLLIILGLYWYLRGKENPKRSFLNSLDS